MEVDLPAKRTIGLVHGIERIKECLPENAPTVELNGKSSMPFCSDSGAEVSDIGRQHVLKLMEQDNSVKLLRVDRKKAANTFGRRQLTPSRSVKVNVMLNTVTWSVNMVEPDTNDADSIGCDDNEDIRFANGSPAQFRDELVEIVNEFDIWWLQLGEYPPVKVAPLFTPLKGDTQPVKCKARQYPPHQREFMEKLNKNWKGSGGSLRTQVADGLVQHCQSLSQAAPQRPLSLDKHMTTEE
ncbi:unnamed protein product [Phytophthora fragariaefolia]|uniref:Unnamed protein product n=1 Tax=Phytophthora fragariaefolia TaxID=1490495 RepID=A0A9W6U0Y2_9STRA|nr:unnamed protein product [Phytophthora fragariaefolia]